MPPVCPPSCKAYELIEDKEERVEQIRSLADQLKSAVKQMDAIPADFMPPETRKQKEDMENQVREMETYIAELKGEARPAPVCPPSCKAYELIEDEEERVEQIRLLADQLKSAVKQMDAIPADFMPPETRKQKEDMENQVHEMETYIAALTGEEPPAPPDASNQNGGSMDWMVVTNNDGVLDEREEFAGILLPHASPVERDAAGNFVLPESLTGFEGLVNSGMDPGFVASSLKSNVDAYKSAMEGMSSLPRDDPALMDLAQKVADFQAIINALVPAVEMDEYKNVQTEMQACGKDIMNEINACEGDTMEEKTHRHTRKNYKILMEDNPLFGRIQENNLRIANACMKYGPPKYQTSVLHEDGQPYLKHFIGNYLDGLEGFAEDLAAGLVQGYNTSDDCEAFRRILEEVSAPNLSGESTWDDVKKNVFLLCATLGSTPIMNHWMEEKYQGSIKGEDLPAMQNDNFFLVKEIASKSMASITAKLQAIEQSMRESGDLKKLSSLEFIPEKATTSFRQDNDDALGNHPVFLKNSEFLKRPPCPYPTNVLTERMHHLYLTHDEIGLQFQEENLDEDLRAKLSCEVDIQRKAKDGVMKSMLLTHGKKMEEIRYFDRTTTQPFLYWMIHVCRRVAPIFHARMKELFGDKYSGAPVKRIARADAKVKEDYSHLDENMPSAARLLDLVRGLIVCSSAEEMCMMFEKICSNFEVIRVKNGFVGETRSGFRQILMNLRFDPRDDSILPEGCGVICEFQLNLESYVHVKHQIHLLYQIARCEKHEEVPVILQESAQPF